MQRARVEPASAVAAAVDRPEVVVDYAHTPDALNKAFGPDPGRMPLQAIVFSARKG